MRDNSQEILNGRIFPALTRFSIPILFSLVLQALYGAVDLWMVSQFASKADVSAVSNGSQTMIIVNGIITGLAMGITVLLGQALGKDDKPLVKKILGSSIWIFSVLALLLTIILTSTGGVLVDTLNVPGEARVLAREYILICGAGTIFVVAFNVLNSVFCGFGDSKTPLYFVGIACVVNIILDYLLIAILGLGTVGASIATIVAQAVSVICSLFLVRGRLPRLTREDFIPDRRLILNILKLGAPIALLRMVNEISYLVILGFTNKLNVVASAGVGIAEKLVMFILLIPTAYMSAISAFVAINKGAGNYKRARASMWVGMLNAIVIGGIMAYLSFMHGDLLSRIFISDTDVIEASSEFLRATAIECFILGLAYAFNGYFNGVEKTGFVMLQGLVACLLIRIPYAYFASISDNPSLFNIGMSVAYAAIFMLVASAIYYFIDRHKENKKKIIE